MEGTFIEALVEHTSRPQVVKVNGVEHLAVPEAGGGFILAELSAPVAQPDPLGLSTLTGLIQYVQYNRDVLPLDECVLHVVDHATVELRGKLTGAFAQRATYARATVGEYFGRGFGFGHYVDHETFLVALQALFVDDFLRQDVLRLLVGIKDGEVRTFEDDGMSQTVTARAGVALVSTRPVPNPVTLCPFRTFREIAQPSSLFVLRLKSGSGDSLPSAALFEADGGAWKLEAITRIAAFLTEQLGETIAIIA